MDTCFPRQNCPRTVDLLENKSVGINCNKSFYYLNKAPIARQILTLKLAAEFVLFLSVGPSQAFAGREARGRPCILNTSLVR